MSEIGDRLLELLRAEPLRAGDRRIVDGDTVDEPFLDPNVRTAGVNAPERAGPRPEGELSFGQPGAEASARVLQSIMSEPGATLETTSEMAQDRVVGRYTDARGRDVGERLIETGAAFPTRFSTPEQRDAERVFLARASGVGEIVDDPADRARAQEMLRALSGDQSVSRFNPFAGRPTIENRSGPFARSIYRGADTAQQSLYAFAQLAGESLGIDVLAQLGEQGVRRNMIEAAANPAEIDSLDDVETLADLGTYVIEALGENLPNIAMVATGAGTGAAIARAAIGKAALRTLRRAALTGAAAAGFPMHVGETDMGLREQGKSSTGTALLAGTAKTALDVFGIERVLSLAFRGLERQMAADLVKRVAEEHGLKGAAKLLGEVAAQGGRAALVGAAFEGGTEGLQEIIDLAAEAYVNPEFDPFGPEARKRVREAMAKGAAAGGGMAGAGRVASTAASTILAYLRGGQTGQTQEQPQGPEQPSTPTPESQGTIDAQAAAVADPTSAKDTMLVTPGSPMPTQMPEGAQVVETPQGTVITTSPEQAVAAEQAQTDQDMGALLFGEAGKQGKPADADRVVEAVDAQGQPVAQIAAGPSNLEAARAEAAAQAPAGGEVRERDPRDVIVEREERRITEAEENELAELIRRAAAREQERRRTRVVGTAPRAAVFEDVVDPTLPQQPRERVELPSEPVEEAVAFDEGEENQLSMTGAPEMWTRTLREGFDLDELQKLKTKARILKRFIPGLEADVDEQARTVTLRAPLDAPQLRDVETGASIYDAVVRSVIEGERAQTMRTEWTHPEILSESKKSAGKSLQLRLNTQALVYFGAALRGRSGPATPFEVRSDLLTALGWMFDNGFQLQGYQSKKFKAVKGPRPEQPKKSGPGAYVDLGDQNLLPDDAVVFRPAPGREWTWGYLTKELPRHIDRLRRRWNNAFVALREGRGTQSDMDRWEHEMRSAEAQLRELGASIDDGRAAEFFDSDEWEPPVQDDETFGDSVLREAESLDDQARAAARESRRAQIRAGREQRVVDLPVEAAPSRGTVDEPPAMNRVQRLERALAETASPRRRASLERQLSDARQALEMQLAQRAPEQRQATITRQRQTTVAPGAVRGSPNLRRLANIAQEILSLIGYGDLVVNFADDSGLHTFAADEQYHHGLIHIAETRPLASIIFPRSDRPGAPLIYINSRLFEMGLARQTFVLGHELGHLIQVVHFDRASPEVRNAVIEALGRENFAENFANEVAKWVLTRPEPRNVVERFFRALVDRLRALWQALRRRLKLNQTFSEYMDALLGAGLVRAGKMPEPLPVTDFGKRVHEFLSMPRSPFLPPNPVPQEYLDFNHPELLEQLGETARRGLARVAGERRAQQLIEWGQKKVKAMGKYARWGYDILLRSEASWLQSLGSERLDEILTDRFHRTPGRPSKAKGGTFYQRLDMEGAPFLNELNDIAGRFFPREPSWFEQKLLGRQPNEGARAEYRRAFEELRQSKRDQDLQSPIAKEVRAWMRKLHAWASRKGVELTFAPEDFPALFDLEKVHESREEIIRKLQEAGYSLAEAQRFYEVIGRNYPPFHFVRRSTVVEDFPTPDEYADRGQLPSKVVEALSEYVVDNLYDTLASYLHTLIRRGVMQEMFGLTPEQRRDPTVRGQFERAGISTRDPLAALKFELQELAASGEIPVAAYERIINRTLQNFLGRQHAQLNPVARRAMSVVMVWQNWAKMSLSVLSSIMDIGVVAWKASRPLKTIELTLRGLFSRRTREQLLNDAKMLGAVRDDVIAHVLSDIGAGDSYMTHTAKKWNDRLFRWNGLHALTSLQRAISLHLGKEAIKRWAREGDEQALRALELLGTNRDEVLGWIEAGEPLAGPGHDNVRAALFQWVDESVVRPTAPMRPEWGNNPHLMLIWHLKSWMWGYTEMILKQAWNSAKSREGMEKVLPFVLLGAFTLPLAALGYELRGWITRRDKDFEPRNGFDYVWEVAQRAGVFGIFQMYVDMEEARDYGRLALISVLGPTASSIEDLYRRDLDYFFKKNLPGAAIIQGILRRVHEDPT